MEIERKFLVKHLPENYKEHPRASLEQAYVHATPTIRIRNANDTYILTIKSKGSLERQELEMIISKEEYLSLMSKKTGHIISKDRYKIPLGHELTAELDLFNGDLQGLMYVEVEFKDVDQAHAFKAPDWFGQEVTEDYSFTNQSLAINGLPESINL